MIDALQSLMADPTTTRLLEATSARAYRTSPSSRRSSCSGCYADGVGSGYYLGLMITAIILAISAVSIGFLAHQSGLMMFGAAAFTGGATYLYAMAITEFDWDVMFASAFTLLASTLLSS